MREATRVGWLLAGLTLLVSIGGLAATWYVNPGDDIQGVINGAAAGDTVIFAPGTYNLATTINIAKPLTILGAQANVDPRPSTGGRTGPETLLKSTTTVFDIRAHDVVINGFSIEANINNANTNIIHDNSTSFASQNATVAYNIITNTGSTMNEAIKIRVGESPVIAYNYIYNIPSPGDAINFDRVTNGRIEYNEIVNSGSENAAIYVYSSEYTWIVGNIVDTTTKNDGIKLGAKNGGDASKSGGWIIDNVVMNTAQDGIAVYMSNVVIEGSTVTGSRSENGAVYLAFGISNIVIRYNTIVDNTLNIHKWGSPGGITIGSAVNVSTVQIYGNTITDNYPVDVANMASGAPLVDATGNWWGQDTGPLAGQIAGNVAYSPWLGNEPSEPVWTFVVAQAGPELAAGYLQTGLNIARPGDTVLVKAGTYATAPRIGKPLTVQGEPGATVQLGFWDWISIQTDDVTIRGLTITGNPFYWALEAGLMGTGPFRNIRLEGNTFLAGRVPIWFENVSDSIIIGNTFADAGPTLWWGDGVTICDNDISSARASGVWVYYTKNVDISGNWIIGGSHPDGTGDSGIHAQASEDLRIVANTIAGFLAGERSGYTHGVAGAGINELGGDGTEILWNVISDNSVGIRVYDLGGSAGSLAIHFNSITGNVDYGVFVFGAYPTAAGWKTWHYDQYGPAAHDVNAALNWWGSVSGPTHAANPDGSGDAVSDNVIYSPWLGTDPDGDPTQPGVQVTGPVTIIVAPVGPEPPDGYLNTAIAGANELPFADTIKVREGTYNASTPVTGPTSIFSCSSCPNPATLTGTLSLQAAGILIGRMGEGFTILGDITVGAGVDASTIHINWNDIYGDVTNSGLGVLDATYNWWGGRNPGAATFGLVNYYPYLPRPVCEVLEFMSSQGLDANAAIFLLSRGGLLSEGLLILDLMTRYGLTREEAETLLNEFGFLAVTHALDFAFDYDDFVRLLLGYGAAPAGGAGSFVDLGIAGGAGAFQGQLVDAIYEAGQPIFVSFELQDFQGNPVTAVGGWVTLIQLHENGHQTVWYWGATRYNPATGLQE
ncbi:right-handed parallel beta-helix repeat-containing protein, partial [Candidatus Bipolaricaulota bacterium]|nr:right-handed parallel beta-helix repeat-containing protein [Candidatus Bipolaricaulota bacterium]